MTAIIERTAAKLVRHGSAQRRRPDSACSLNHPVLREDGPPTELANTIDDKDLHRRHQRSTIARQEQSELAIDIQTLLKRCSRRERELCKRLMRDGLAGTVRKSKTARSTLCDRVRTLQKRFEQAGLKDYL